MQCDHHIQLLEDHIKIGLWIQESCELSGIYWKRHKATVLSEANKLEQAEKANAINREWQFMLGILEKVATTTKENYNKPRNQRTTMNNRRSWPGIYQEEHLQATEEDGEFTWHRPQSNIIWTNFKSIHYQSKQSLQTSMQLDLETWQKTSFSYVQ